MNININHLDQYGGVDTSSKPHLISPKKWRTLHNIRAMDGLSQFPRKYIHQQIAQTDDNPETVLQLGAVPTVNNRSLLVAITNRQLYQYKETGDFEILKWENNQFRFVDDGRYRRWSTFQYNNFLYFSNELNQVRYTDGANVRSLGTRIPAARYIDVFFDHLVAANVRYMEGYYPTRVMWSALYNFGLFDPDKTNEADYVDLEEWCLADVPVRGITGIRKMRDSSLYVYTPTAIVQLRYVGLPKIMQFNAIHTDVGNGLPNALVSFRDEHFFYNILDHNFYRLSGGELQVIGDGIRGYWLNNIDLTDLDAVEKVWGYPDRENNEVTWCFKSVDSVEGEIDKAVVFNWRTGEWYHRDVENLHSFFWGGLRAKSCKEFTLGANQYSDSAFTLGDGGRIRKLFGTTNGWVLAEDDGTGSIEDLIEVDGPTLETGDYVYDDPVLLKDVDGIVVHANWDNGRDVLIEYSVRENFEDEVAWKVFGMWSKTGDRNKPVDFAAAGKIWRFRFTIRGEEGTATVIDNTRAEGTFSLSVEAEVEDYGEEENEDDPPATYIPFKKFNGPVYCFSHGPEGKIYVTGRFTKYGNEGEGWANAPGIALIGLDGEMDAGFQPGDGFDVAEPYYAPTQMHATADGGVVCGLSRGYLHEEGIHATTNTYTHLRWQNATVPPIIKINSDGTRDTSFDTSFLGAELVDPTLHYVNSFHLWELRGYWFVMHVADVDVVLENGELLQRPANCVVDRRTWAGALQVRHMIAGAGQPPARLRVLHEDELVILDGFDNTSNEVAQWKIVAGVAYRKNQMLPATSTLGWIVLSSDLDLQREFSWATRTGDVGDVGCQPTPYYTIHGMFAESFVSGCYPGTPGEFTGGGQFAGGPKTEMKGAYNVNVVQGLDEESFSEITHSGSGVLESRSAEISFRNDTVRIEFDCRGVDTLLTVMADHPELGPSTLYTGVHNDAGFLTIAKPSDEYDSCYVVVNELDVGTAGCMYTLRLIAPHPVWDPKVIGLWDLRHTGEDDGYVSDGFGLPTTYKAEWNNMMPLWAYRVWDEETFPTSRTRTYVGTWITGPATKFKGSEIHTLPYQLHKVMSNGSLDSRFSAHEFGPAYPGYVDDMVTGDYPAIFCAALSVDQMTLYVGGRFKEFNGSDDHWMAVSLLAATGKHFPNTEV